MGDLDSNGSDNELTNKDERLRAKMNKFRKEVGELVKMILGDKDYQDYQKRKWDLKIKLVRKMMEQLKDPQFVLQLMQKIIMENESNTFDVKKAAIALQKLQLILEQSNSGTTIEAFQEVKKDSQSLGEELKQMMDILEQKHQSVKEARVYTSVAKMLQKVVDSCSNIAAYDILNQDASQVEGHHGVKIEGKQLRITFPRTPDSIQTNQKGKNADVHNQEMIIQEKQGNEVTLTLQSVAGILAELTLAMKISNQEMNVQAAECGSNGWDLKSLTNFFFNDVAGTTDAVDEANVTLSPETCWVESYKVLNCNANVLTEIFQKHPDTAINFGLKTPKISELLYEFTCRTLPKHLKKQPEDARV